MSQFKHTSWGRTRRPKNVKGNSSTEQATTLGAIPPGNSAADIAGSVSTENQRFLHLLLDLTGPIPELGLLQFMAFRMP